MEKSDTTPFVYAKHGHREYHRTPSEEVFGMTEYFVHTDLNNSPDSFGEICPEAGCNGRIITTKIKDKDGWNGEDEEVNSLRAATREHIRRDSDIEDELESDPLYRYHNIKQLIVKTCSCVFEGTCEYQADITCVLEGPARIQGYSCDIEDELESRGVN